MQMDIENLHQQFEDLKLRVTRSDLNEKLTKTRLALQAQIEETSQANFGVRNKWERNFVVMQDTITKHQNDEREELILIRKNQDTISSELLQKARISDILKLDK